MARRSRPPNQSQAGIYANGILGIAWEIRPWGKTKFVGSVMGDGGKDWGWTDNRAEAKELTPYWQRRYRADRKACGIPFQQQPIPADALKSKLKPLNSPSEQIDPPDADAALDGLCLISMEDGLRARTGLPTPNKEPA